MSDITTSANYSVEIEYQDYMRRAIELAKKGLFTTTPNPRVGCVIVNNHKIVGTGYHQRAGQAHAEVNALALAGQYAQGATAYVTLEPCTHFGRTPPCVEGLIAAKISSVVIGSVDPNPQVSGAGISQLEAAGITVITGICQSECDVLNKGFFKRMRTGLPYVTVKMAMSMDGKIATKTGHSQWITGEVARADVQQLRAQSCAVMSSSGTVIADNPSLNVRIDGINRQPKRVIVDSHLSISSQAKLFDLDGEMLIYYGLEKNDSSSTDKKNTQQSLIIEKVSKLSASCIPVSMNGYGHANLHDVLFDLGQNQQCNEVLVEAGGQFAGALLTAGLVDELVIYQAPILLGHEAKSAFHLENINKLSDAYGFQVREYSKIGNDVKCVLARVESTAS